MFHIYPVSKKYCLSKCVSNQRLSPRVHQGHILGVQNTHYPNCPPGGANHEECVTNCLRTRSCMIGTVGLMEHELLSWCSAVSVGLLPAPSIFSASSSSSLHWSCKTLPAPPRSSAPLWAQWTLMRCRPLAAPKSLLSPLCFCVKGARPPPFDLPPAPLCGLLSSHHPSSMDPPCPALLSLPGGGG